MIRKLILLFLIISLTITCNSGIPKKFDNIPKESIWKGGADEGFWINLVSKKSNKYHFKIFDDFDGGLALEGYFSPAGKCKPLESMPEKTILNEIFVFEDYTIQFTKIACKLELIEPILNGRMKKIE